MMNNVLSIKQLNQLVKDVLHNKIGQIWLTGEISNFSSPASGHWYFTLKDDVAQVRCAMFRFANIKTNFKPKDGQQVLVLANATLYEARGEFQLIIDKLQLDGIGALQQKFEQLKTKLQSEGLFDLSHKKTIPKYIKKVGIITSATGAALHDICNILKRRDPSIEIIIYPSLVQGAESAKNISKMIEIANKRAECDVLIVGRGGGSLEDLWSFNEEIVAYAIFKSKLPIISAVGHEVDFTIADFVADLRAATPSAAAEMISQETDEKLKSINQLEQQIHLSFDNFILKKQAKLQTLKQLLQQQHPQIKLTTQYKNLIILIKTLQQAVIVVIQKYNADLTLLEKKLQQVNPNTKVQFFKQKLIHQNKALQTNIQQILIQKKHQTALLSGQLHSVSPLATLERGYSVTKDSQNRVLRSVKQIKEGDMLKTRITKATITSKIISIDKKII